MSVDAIRLQNFMAFENTGWIELRPVTLLFGRNSSGKSAIVRALLLLRQSLKYPEKEGPLTFYSPYGIDLGDFREMVHKGEESQLIWFHFRFPGSGILASLNGLEPIANMLAPETMVEFGLAFQAMRKGEKGPEQSPYDTSKVEISGLRISLHSANGGEDVLLFEANYLDPEDAMVWGEDWVAQGLLTELSATDDWSGFECNRHAPLLEPTALIAPRGDTEGWAYLDELYKAVCGILQDFLLTIVHIGPLRPEPQRRYSFDRAMEFEWRERGWSAFLDFLSGKMEKDRSDRIGHWLSELDLAASAETRATSRPGAITSEFEIGIQEFEGAPAYPLSSVGSGLSQVLPVIVQTVAAEPGSLVIIEQPELHLHPAAQAELGDFFLQLSLVESRPIFLLETHSEHLILRIMRRMRNTARNELPKRISPTTPENVAVNVTSRERQQSFSTIHRMDLSPEGKLMEPWPGGFFEEGFRERFAKEQ